MKNYGISFDIHALKMVKIIFVYVLVASVHKVRHFCPRGKYSQTVGATRCAECWTGSYSLVTGLGSLDGCIDCMTGYYDADLNNT